MAGPVETGRAKKAFALRLDAGLHAALERAAANDLRSVNAQIECLLREALARRGVKLDEPVAVKRGRPLKSSPEGGGGPSARSGDGGGGPATSDSLAASPLHYQPAAGAPPPRAGEDQEKD